MNSRNQAPWPPLLSTLMTMGLGGTHCTRLRTVPARHVTNDPRCQCTNTHVPALLQRITAQAVHGDAMRHACIAAQYAHSVSLRAGSSTPQLHLQKLRYAWERQGVC